MKSACRSIGRVAAVILLFAMSPTAAELPPCPASPNCVSSQAGDSRQQIAPLAFTGEQDVALRRLKQVLLNEPRMTIVREEAGYLHAEARSRVFRFVDDVEFLLDADNGVIQVRSAPPATMASRAACSSASGR